MTPTAHYIQTLKSQTPTDSELIDLMTALHDAVLETPLMQCLDRSFEDMADSVTRATACADLEQLEGETA